MSKQSTCQKCGFSYGWDGTICTHCNPPALSGVPATSAKTQNTVPEQDVPVSWVDQILSILFFGFVGGVVVGIINLVLVGWEAFKDLVATCFFGDSGEDPETWKYMAIAGFLVGVVIGGLAGWDITRRKKKRSRR